MRGLGLLRFFLLKTEPNKSANDIRDIRDGLRVGSEPIIDSL